jgi:hypothetical protein
MEIILMTKLLLQFYEKDAFVKPTHRWNGEKPKIAVLFDDCLGWYIFKTKKIKWFSNILKTFGTIVKEGVLLVFLYFLCYNRGSVRSAALNKVIRNQCTSMIIFKTKDKKELEGIAESCSGEIDDATFYKVYDNAMEDGEFPFLFIDLHKKPEHFYV